MARYMLGTSFTTLHPHIHLAGSSSQSVHVVMNTNPSSLVVTDRDALAEAKDQELPCEIVRGLSDAILRVERTEVELARSANVAELVAFAEDNGLVLLS